MPTKPAEEEKKEDAKKKESKPQEHRKVVVVDYGKEEIKEKPRKPKT